MQNLKIWQWVIFILLWTTLAWIIPGIAYAFLAWCLKTNKAK